MPDNSDAGLFSPPAAVEAISSMATRGVLAELARVYERRCRCRLSIDSIGGVDAARRVRAGAPFDLVILARATIDELVAEGHLMSGTEVDLVHSGVAVAVRAGEPRPDIGTEEAVRRAITTSRSIGISTGPSGSKLGELIARWGLAAELRGRLVTATPGVSVGALLASGEVDLAFQQRSELIGVEGIIVLGPLPAPIQIVTTFAGAVGARARQPEAAREALAFLASPAAADAKRQAGMEAPDAASARGGQG